MAVESPPYEWPTAMFTTEHALGLQVCVDHQGRHPYYLTRCYQNRAEREASRIIDRRFRVRRYPEPEPEPMTVQVTVRLDDHSLEMLRAAAGHPAAAPATVTHATITAPSARDRAEAALVAAGMTAVQVWTAESGDASRS